MPDPEIARRCLSCGASVRHSAAFCPQCGQFLEKRATDSDPVTDVQPPDPATTIDESQEGQDSDSESAPTLWAPALPQPELETADESGVEQQSDSESAPTLWAPALPQPELETIDESEGEQHSDNQSAPTLWAPALPQPELETADESEGEQHSDSESAPTIWAPALPRPELETADESQDGQQSDSESAPTIWAPALPEPAIVRPQQETVEPSAPNILATRPIIRDEAPRVLETQPLIANTALSNQTQADTPGPAVLRPGQSPPSGTERPLRDRVDKIRKVSSVMIDQAAYDPSLRFLLVAAVLFIIFLVLMLLSKVVG